METLTNHETPSFAEPQVEKNPPPLEQTELAGAPSIDRTPTEPQFSGSSIQQTDTEPQTPKKINNDSHRQAGADTPIEIARLLEVGIWLKGLHRRVDSLKKSPEGKIIVRVEISPFEIDLPEWDHQLSWEANYRRIVAQVKTILAHEVNFMLTEIPEPTLAKPPQ